MLFAVGTGARIEPSLPHPAISITWALGITSLAAFLFLIDYTARLLRPISIVWRIGEEGIKVIENVYPDPAHMPGVPHHGAAPTAVARTVEHRGTSGIVLAANLG